MRMLSKWTRWFSHPIAGRQQIVTMTILSVFLRIEAALKVANRWCKQILSDGQLGHHQTSLQWFRSKKLSYQTAAIDLADQLERRLKLKRNKICLVSRSLSKSRYKPKVEKSRNLSRWSKFSEFVRAQEIKAKDFRPSSITLRKPLRLNLSRKLLFQRIKDTTG